MDAGTIVYKNPAFKNVLYLQSDLAKPEYPFEEEGETREDFLNKKSFAIMASDTLEADADDIEGFEKFTKRYADCIPAEKAAIETLKD